MQKQILNAPANATSDPNLQKALTAAFEKPQRRSASLSKEINSKISKLLKPVNQDLSVNLDFGDFEHQPDVSAHGLHHRPEEGLTRPHGTT